MGGKARSPLIGSQRVGSQRVQSWLYDVINVLIGALGTETQFLERGNLTWRFYNRELEYVLPIVRHMSPMARPVLRDFLRATSKPLPCFNHHDDVQIELRDQAGQAQDTLLNNGAFRELAISRLSVFMNLKGPLTYPGGAFPESRFPELMAERVVNNIRELPSHYTDSVFWSEHRNDFLAFRKGKFFTMLDATKEKLLDIDHQLTEWLSDKSYELCEQYDLAAAPSSGSFY